MDTLYLYNVVQHASHTPVDVYIHIIHMTPLWSAAKGWLLALILALILKDIIANSYNLLCSLMAWSVCLKCSLFRWTVSARSNYLRQHCQARVEISSWWTIYLWIVYIYINTDIIIYIYIYVCIYICMYMLWIFHSLCPHLHSGLPINCQGNDCIHPLAWLKGWVAARHEPFGGGGKRGLLMQVATWCLEAGLL